MKITTFNNLDEITGNEGKILLYDEAKSKIGASTETVNEIIQDQVGGDISRLDDRIDTVESNLTSATNTLSGAIALKADADKVYTKTEVDEKFADFGGFEVTEGDSETGEPVVENPDVKKIYLVKKGTKKDKYCEWIWSKEEGSSENTWVLIGETTVDLSDYAKTVDVDAELALKEDKVFVAEYNVTPYADIKAAYDDGKQIVCQIQGSPDYKYANLIENFIMGDNSSFQFSISFGKGYIQSYSCSKINGWSELFNSQLQDKLTFAGENNTITAINTSAVGTTIAAGTDLVINNGVIGVNTNGAAIGNYSFVEGVSTEATAYASHAEGLQTKAHGTFSHAEGQATSAIALAAHSEGLYTLAQGSQSHAEGLSTNASSNCSHAEGARTSAIETCTHAEGADTIASGAYSHAEGRATSAVGTYSHAEGLNTFAADIADHVEGIGGRAEQGGCNHVEGFQYHSYTVNGPASYFYGTNKVKFYNNSTFTINGGTINGSLYELVKVFKDKFIVSCEYSSPTEYHYVTNAFFKPKLYKIIDVNLIDVNLIEETTQFEITIDGTFDCQSGGSIVLWGPTTISYIIGGGGGLTPGQSVNIFTTNGLGFPGNNLENVRTDNCFLIFTVYYTPAGASESTSFYKIIRPTSITYDSSTNVYTFELDESIEIPSDAAGGDYSFAVQVLNSDYYGCNHIEGRDNVIKNGECSHVEGSNNYINGSCSHAEGQSTSAIGKNSHTEGNNTNAIGAFSHAEGFNTIASDGGANYTDAEHAEGYQTSAFGRGSHAEGTYTIASANGGQCHAEGYMTTALADHAHAEGQQTKAAGSNAHAEGYGTSAVGVCSHAEGQNTSAAGYASHSEGGETQANGQYSHAQGYQSTANGNYSFAAGSQALASDDYSISLGNHATTRNSNAIAIGTTAQAYGQYSVGIGYNTIANDSYSIAIGNNTTAYGYNAAAIGYSTSAVGQYSLAVNGNTSAAGNNSFAGGQNSYAGGYFSFAFGQYASANSNNSVSIGMNTFAGNYNTTVIGKNNTNSTAAFIVGNGNDSDNRSDAFIVDWEGVASATTLKNADGIVPSFIPTASQPAGTTACSMYVDANGKFYIVTAN